MKITDDERALAVMQFARGYLTWNNMQEHDDALQHIRARLAATQEAKPNTRQNGGGEVVAGLVSGYLPASRCVEIKLDGPIPDWVKELPKRAYLTSTAELEAVGRSGEGHNADWCAGWNAHNLIMSAPQPSIPAPAQQDGKASGGEVSAEKVRELVSRLEDKLPSLAGGLEGSWNRWRHDTIVAFIGELKALAHPPHADQETQG